MLTFGLPVLACHGLPECPVHDTDSWTRRRTWRSIIANRQRDDYALGALQRTLKFSDDDGGIHVNFDLSKVMRRNIDRHISLNSLPSTEF